jgi:hypothetical protein
MKLKDMLVSMFYTACVITTSMVFFIGLYLVLFTPHLIFDGRDMLGLIFTAFAGVLPTLIFVGKDKMSYKGVLFCRAIHLVLTAGIVFGCVMYFEWINTLNAVYYLIDFFIIYIVANVVSTIRDKKLANKLNERINAFHDAENETHRKQP